MNLSPKIAFVALAAILASCGDNPPLSVARTTMNEYFWGTYDTGCVAMSEKKDFVNLTQRSSRPMGESYIERHFIPRKRYVKRRN